MVEIPHEDLRVTETYPHFLVRRKLSYAYADGRVTFKSPCEKVESGFINDDVSLRST